MNLRFEDFELLGKLSDDGLWETWLARAVRRDPGVPPLAFVKRIPNGRTSMRETIVLHRQVSRASNVTNRYLLPILSHGKQDDDYMVLRAASPAEALASLHQRHINQTGLLLPVEASAGILHRVIQVLAALHGLTDADRKPVGVVHGALTPGSVLVDYRGGVQVVDAGLQILKRPIEAEEMPERLWRYYAPEAIAGDREERSDVYSVGAIAWELFTGRPLFGPCAAFERTQRIAASEVPRVRSVNPDVPPALDDLIARSLSKSVDNRYADGVELLDAFEVGVLPALHLMGSAELSPIVNELFGQQRSAWSEALRAVVDKDSDRAVELFRELLRGEAALDEPLGVSSAGGVPETTVPQRVASVSPEDTLPDRAEPSIQISESLYEYDLDEAEEEMRATTPIADRFHQYEEPAPPAQAGYGEFELYDKTLPPNVKPAPAPMTDPALSLGPDVMEELQDDDDAFPDLDAHGAPGPVMAEDAGSRIMPAPAGHNQIDDDGDDALPFFEPFPIEAVITHASKADAGGKHTVVEVIKLVDGVVTANAVLSGLSRKFSDQGLVVKSGGKKTTVSYEGETEGTIRMESSELELIPSSPGKFRLRFGEQATIEKNGATYLIRYFRPPDVPAKVRRQDPREWIRPFVAAFGISVLAHIIGLGSVVLTESMGLSMTIDREPTVEVFAEGTLEKPKPPPEEKKPPKPKPKPTPPKPKAPSKPTERKVDPTEQKPVVPKSVRKKLEKRLKERPTKQEESGADSLVAALKTGVIGEGETVADTVTNIDAIKSPGQPSSLRVAGTIAAIEGDEVNVGRGGSKKIGDLTKGVDGGTGKLEKRKSEGKVRGKVRATKALARVQGSLSKAEVYGVISKHQQKILRCYEKQLAKKPGLSGKVTFEWTVKTDGSVRSVSEVASTLNDAATSKCVIGVIKSMKFPKPKGGEVEIRYPFFFQTQ